ncbi:MAG TPA: hypothetical protein VMX94_09415 [Armatimonadota bacterium]|nr:hypothetical protein [Armatimonadota bacterium]
MRRLAVLVVLLCTAGTACAGRPLPKRVWQLQDYNMPHIVRVIGLAHEYGINEIQLSHNIIMSAEHVLDDEKRTADINAICKYAHKNRIRVSVWTHELSGVPKDFSPDGRINVDDPGLWAWLTDKYNKFFDLCPDLDGIVLTMAETQASVYHETMTSKLTPSQRVGKLIDTLAGVCKSRGKQLVVRSFCHQPSELQFIRDGFAQAKSDFVVMSKCQPHDWQPFYPHNPLIGNVGGRPQIVEFDCGHEFLGQGEIPYIDVEYMKRRLDYDVSKGIVGAVARIERYGNHALDTPNWADVYVLSKLMQDPSRDPNCLLEEYVSQRYGKKAVPYVVPALKRTFDIVNKTFLALSFWVTDHSRVTSYDYAIGHVTGRSTAKWDPDPKWAEIEKQLMSPDFATLRQIQREKDEALALCKKSIQEIEQARPVLAASDYGELMTYFRREEAVVRTWRAHLDAIFSVRAYEVSGDPIYRAWAEMAIADDLACADKYADELREITGDGAGDSIKRTNEFVAGLRARMDKVSINTTSQ